MNLTHQEVPVSTYDIQAEAELMADAILSELNLDDIEAKMEGADACVITTGNRYDDISEEHFNRKKVAKLRKLYMEGKYEADPKATAEALLMTGNL